ncbi:MAG: mandelate racemase/muconate lactonizing enzyme family protein [Bacteroidales bacterium]|nr:mandelate racemase/muconate lactonizing enzyme family protein [Bacteroidales bacterium]
MELHKNRRSFLKKAGLGGLGLAMLKHASAGEQIEYLTQDVSRYSAPSDLKITDMRIAQLGNVPIVKIYTNQGVHGLGDVRDGADKRYALMLKSRILGENPCNVERIFKIIKQFGDHGRQGGGVSGVEMALWDLTGKVYHVPLYQLLGGKYRDRVRIYVDTPAVNDPEQFAIRMRDRIDQGFTILKMDIGIGLIREIPGILTNTEPWGDMRGWEQEKGSYGLTMHPFTRVQITDKGIAEMVKYLAAMREQVGWEVPVAIDHLGHMGLNSMIRLGNAFEPYNIAWLEDLIPWQYVDQWKEISRAIHVPTLTGEDIYLKEGFRELIEKRAVDMVHPDPVSAGGYLETKRIGDYAEEKGIAMALHHASSPVSFMGCVHTAAATENFVALEHHSVDNPWWENLVTGLDKPLVKEGYVSVPESPGVGVELNEEVVKEHLRKGEELFAPTEEWDARRSWDRQWS